MASSLSALLTIFGSEFLSVAVILERIESFVYLKNNISPTSAVTAVT